MSYHAQVDAVQRDLTEVSFALGDTAISDARWNEITRTAARVGWAIPSRDAARRAIFRANQLLYNTIASGDPPASVSLAEGKRTLDWARSLVRDLGRFGSQKDREDMESSRQFGKRRFTSRWQPSLDPQKVGWAAFEEELRKRAADLGIGLGKWLPWIAGGAAAFLLLVLLIGIVV